MNSSSLRLCGRQGTLCTEPIFDRVLDPLLRTLHDLAAANPDVHIVVSHDAKQLSDYEQSGKIGKGFSPATGK